MKGHEKVINQFNLKLLSEFIFVNSKNKEPQNKIE